MSTPDRCSANDGVWIYRLTQPSGAMARPELIDQSTLRILLRLLQFCCGLERDPIVVLVTEGAYIPIAPSLLPGKFQTVAQLVDDTADINRWLLDWANSNDRRPQPEPAWAIRRGIDSTFVLWFATYISRKIARSSAFNLRIQALGGQPSTLHLPPRNQLVAPQPPEQPASMHATVRSIERFVRGTTPTGHDVLVPIVASAIAQNEKLLIDHTRIHRAKILIANRIKPRQEE